MLVSADEPSRRDSAWLGAQVANATAGFRSSLNPKREQGLTTAWSASFAAATRLHDRRLEFREEAQHRVTPIHRVDAERQQLHPR